MRLRPAPPVDPTDREAVARVRAYPFHDGAAAYEPFDLAGGWAGSGEALVAFGANASAAVLEAKLGPDVPVTARPASLTGFDVAYSAHVSPYGAIPATLVPSPGTAVGVQLLSLAPGALAALDATEPNYTREALGPGVQAYRSRHGALRLDGCEQALAAVPARGRVLPALDETAVLVRVAALLAPGEDPDAFVLAQIRDPAVRERRTRALRSTTKQ
jgi:hypothetical protein